MEADETRGQPTASSSATRNPTAERGSEGIAEEEEHQSIDIAESEGEEEESLDSNWEEEQQHQQEDNISINSNSLSSANKMSHHSIIHTYNKQSSSKKEDPVIDLSTMLKSLKVTNPSKSSKHQPPHLCPKYPFLCYTWKDEINNKFITIEVLLNGCGESCTVEIVEVGDGTQVLSVSQALPPSWLSMKHFKSHCDFGTYNGTQRFGARKEAMKTIEARLKYQGFRDTNVLTKQLFKLPFRCDDLNIWGGYPGTGSQEESWDVVEKVSKARRNSGSGRRRKSTRTEVAGSVNVLTIHLVAEEKIQMRKEKTPKKKKLRSVMAGSESDSDASSSDDSSDEDDSEQEQDNENDGVSFDMDMDSLSYVNVQSSTGHQQQQSQSYSIPKQNNQHSSFPAQQTSYYDQKQV